MKKSVQSTKEIIYDTRSGKSGVVNIGFTNITFNKEQQYFRINVIEYLEKTRIVVDSSQVDGLDEDVVEPYKEIINSKPCFLEKTEADTMYQNAVASGLAVGQSFVEYFNDLVLNAIYYDTINETGDNGQLLYNTNPEDWALVNQE